MFDYQRVLGYVAICCPMLSTKERVKMILALVGWYPIVSFHLDEGQYVNRFVSHQPPKNSTNHMLQSTYGLSLASMSHACKHSFLTHVEEFVDWTTCSARRHVARWCTWWIIFTSGPPSTVQHTSRKSVMKTYEDHVAEIRIQSWHLPKFYEILSSFQSERYSRSPKPSQESFVHHLRVAEHQPLRIHQEQQLPGRVSGADPAIRHSAAGSRSLRFWSQKEHLNSGTKLLGLYIYIHTYIIIHI